MRNHARQRAALFGIPELCAAALMLAPIQASAQLGKQQFSAMPKLTRGDTAIIRKLVREELTTKPAGTTLTWSNPESDNSGTVTLIAGFASQGRECWRVRYAIKPGANQPAAVKPNTYLLNNCRLPDGSWRIDSQARPDARQP